VVDGDTFWTSDGRKIRVLGIDSCEASTYGGTEATAMAKSQLTNP
jgi:endonuclease YncB( thermonuclease family)